MRSVGTRDTGPEWIVRRLLHRNGARYRLHDKRLPGRPDIVLSGRRLAVFVHGCFWHAHDCPKGRAPKSRPEYWQPKLEANRARDALAVTRLRELGWRVEIVWQCETRNEAALEDRLKKLLAKCANPIDRTSRIG